MARKGETRLSEAMHLFVLQEEAVLFDESRQEILDLDRSATLIWCCLAERCAPSEIHRRYAESFGVAAGEAATIVERQLREWQRRGFCGPVAPEAGRKRSYRDAARLLLSNSILRREFLNSPIDAMDLLHVEPAARGSFEALDPLDLEHRAQKRLMRHRRHPASAVPPTLPDPGRATLSPLRLGCRLIDTEFRLTYPRALAGQIRESFSHLPGDGDGEVQIELRFSANGFTVLVDGVPTAGTTAAERVVPLLTDVMRRIAVDRSDPLLSLRAGAVLAGISCLVLPAGPASGKSLLTAALLRAGCSYFTDELAVLERGSLQVRPVPLPLAVTEGGVAPLESLFPGVADLPVHLCEDGKRVRYLAPPADGRFQQERAPVRWIVFPRFEPDRPPRFDVLTAPGALRRLFDECQAYPRLFEPTEVEDLVRWIGRVRCLALTYRSLPEALLLLRGLLGDRRNGGQS